MSQVAKVFQNGRSQAVRLPAEYRFDTSEVYVRRDARTGDVILSRRPLDWEDLFRALDQLKPHAKDFMVDRKDTPAQPRELF